MRHATALLLLGVPVLGLSQDPIETRNSRIESLAFLRFEPRGDLLGNGEKRWSFGFTSANDVRLFPRGGPFTYREDYETDRVTAKYRMGMNRGEWSFEVPFEVIGGGFMDPLIQLWHEHVLGIRGDRSLLPFGQVSIDIPGQERFGSAAGIGDVSATLSRDLGGRLILSGAIKAPTGDAGRLLGSGAADAGLSLNYDWRLGRKFRVYLQAGEVYQGKPRALRNARSYIDQESIALTYVPTDRDSWTLQWQAEPSALVTGYSGSDGAHRMLTLGFERRLDARHSVQAFFSEDGDWANYSLPALDNVAPDFTFGLRFVIKG